MGFSRTTSKQVTPLRGREPSDVSPSHTSKCRLWNTVENKPCEIDRDYNAAVNLFNIGRGLLVEGKRPAFLTRSPKDNEGDLVG